jgi:peptidoglycan hydrolase FlgJ
MDLAGSADLLKPAATPAALGAAALTGASAARIHKAAQDFESSFLQTVLGTMMSTTGDASSPFSGGEGEQAFRSFLTDAMAKGVVKRGGIGLSQVVERELLKMQGPHA